jgi:hypothetical protein
MLVLASTPLVNKVSTIFAVANRQDAIETTKKKELRVFDQNLRKKRATTINPNEIAPPRNWSIIISIYFPD